MEEKIAKALNNFLRRLSNINDDWYDEVELQLLSLDLFKENGTLICCQVDADHLSINKVGFETTTKRSRIKMKGELDITNLINSDQFKIYPIKLGRDLLIGESSVLMIRYNRIDKNPTSFYGVSVDPEKDIELIKSLVSFKEHTKEKNQIYVLRYSSRQGFYNQVREITPIEVNITELYNDDLPYEEIVTGISDTAYGGVFLFHGEPGTGKSTFLRHLIQESRNENYKMVIVPGCFINKIGSDEFLGYCLDQPEGTIFILEDSEEIIRSRDLSGGKSSVLSDILNFGDGILGNISNIKFICTFNISEKNIDNALLRPGRLRVMYRFDKLSLEKTKRFIPNATKPMTLAEIFKEHKTWNKQKHESGGTRVGFLK